MSARDEALAVIEADAGLRALRDRVAAILDDDPGHDLEHCLRVAGWAIRCGEARVDPRECVAAALLHDVVNVPKDHPDRALASERSAARAKQLLPEHGFDAAAIDRIADAVEDHSFSRGQIPRDALGDALQDADRLEALGALGLMRTFSTGARMGARYFHASDPFGQGRDLDDRAFSVDHFHTKLLRLPETLRTERGRAEARRRAELLETFLDRLAEELGHARR
ncbi:MAG: HD domain-containing protein [Sandaracinaceae bacterium]|nr:HD domain-containing protein [Sandaracinaceae bacterium]